MFKLSLNDDKIKVHIVYRFLKIVFVVKNNHKLKKHIFRNDVKSNEQFVLYWKYKFVEWKLKSKSLWNLIRVKNVSNINKSDN